MGSIYGLVGNDPSLYEDTKIYPSAVYAAVKGGIVNFTRFAAARYGTYNIRLNTICPGGIEDRQDPKFISNYSKRVPMGRMGKPEDLVGAAVFLLSEASQYVTGSTLVVDGGWTAI
jgi:NAD(P)-dependent dehydrogenase (short-subunit alcohol dehydrogenase family)